jgi:hypothetical protein
MAVDHLNSASSPASALSTVERNPMLPAGNQETRGKTEGLRFDPVASFAALQAGSEAARKLLAEFATRV